MDFDEGRGNADIESRGRRDAADWRSVVKLRRHRTRRSAALLFCGTALSLVQPSLSLAQEAEGGTITLDTVTIDGEGGSAVGPDSTIVARDTAVGSKTDTPILDVPAAVSVVTEKEMQERDVHTLDEALSYTAGVSTDIYGSDDRYDFYLIRGFYQTGTGTYRDGLPLRIFGYTGARLEPYGMQRIEVLKGSTSTLFGLNAPGGIVNAITKRPTDYAFGEVYTTFGDGHIETGTDVGGPLTATGDWSYRITAKWQDGDNGADHTNDDRLYIAPALTWSPDASTSLTILGDYNKRKGNTSHGIPLGSGLDPDTYLGEPDFDKMDTEEKNIGWLFRHDFGDGFEFRQNARYSDLDLTYESVYGGTLDPADTRSAWAVYGKTKRFSIDNQLEYDTSAGQFDSRLLVGLDYSHDDTSEYRVYGSASGIDPYDPDYCGLSCITLPPGYTWNNTQAATGLYLQEELTVEDSLIFTVGGRFDHVDTTSDYPDYDLAYDSTDNAFTKRFGVTWKTTDEMSLYANYSESFDPLGADRSTIVGEAKPQEGTQYEVGAKYRPDGFDGLFTLALFDLTQTNVPYYVTATTQEQVGKVRVRGAELEAKVAMTDRFDLTAAYSYWDAEILEDGLDGNVGNRPQLVPEHIASLWGDYTIPGEGMIGDLTLGAGVRFIGDTFADNANAIDLDARTTVDAALTYKISANATLQVNATNIFDTRYVAQVDTYNGTEYYNDGRTVRGTLRYSW
ncbi:TonB-dependent siderophore receptor [Jiella endophytica]|uniref:TonB-dependent siderophore receptor n=1 Tax=Jiella endophytica TaxID=2558362 RepID=A0A4Y8RB76_9HYPH|nr:TonB-dependent siderophore receptor [Jiella endophytica]TFF18379.1 TonB-dependent siderophore receptor [Jiella endophytica]